MIVLLEAVVIHQARERRMIILVNLYLSVMLMSNVLLVGAVIEILYYPQNVKVLVFVFHKAI